MSRVGLLISVLALLCLNGCGGGGSSLQGERSGTSRESESEPAHAVIAAGEELAEREKECRSESPKSTECEEVEDEAMELNRHYNQNFEEEANAKLYGKAEAEAAERGEYNRLKGIERLQLERGEVPSEVEIQPKGGPEERAAGGEEASVEQTVTPKSRAELDEIARRFAEEGGDGPG